MARCLCALALLAVLGACKSEEKNRTIEIKKDAPAASKSTDQNAEKKVVDSSNNSPIDTASNDANAAKAIGLTYASNAADYQGSCINYANGQMLTCIEYYTSSTDFSGQCDPSKTQQIDANDPQNSTGKTLVLTQKVTAVCPRAGILSGCAGYNNLKSKELAELVWFYADLGGSCSGDGSLKVAVP